jgi:phosphomannomutase
MIIVYISLLINKNNQFFIINVNFDGMKIDISKNIFRAYDIRGVYKKDIFPEIFYKIGLATGNYTDKIINGKRITIGNDIRQSSIPLVHSFLSGVSATGINVIYTGISSFGQTLFKGWELKHDLICFITASHLPPEWNGIKFYYGDGVGLPEKELNKIRDFTINDEYQMVDWQKIGSVKSIDPKSSYNNFFKSKFKFNKKLKVALDCGGASTTLSAPFIFKSIGLDVVPVFCDPDPSLSKRPSEPNPENLSSLVNTVKEKNCDFGVAFDGDGDRSVIVDNKGNILSADETGIVIGKYGLDKKEGIVIVNVECSKVVKEQLEPIGFNVKQIPVGHTFLTLEAKKHRSPLGIESSGHLILPEYFLFDDALVVPLKIAQIIESMDKNLNDLISDIPKYPSVKKIIKCDDNIKFNVIEKLKNDISNEFDNVNTMDGLRVDLENGWVLIRSSNTSPLIRLTAEADNENILKNIVNNFLEKIEKKINEFKKI